MLNLITPNAARGSRVVEHVLRNPALRARADGVRGRQQGQFVMSSNLCFKHLYDLTILCLATKS
jgi:hypothetical protein